MPTHEEPTAARPPVNPPSFVTVLEMADGCRRFSVPLDNRDDAEWVGRFSLLDADVAAYGVYRWEVPS